MGAARSLGRGNLEGLRFFLANNAAPLRAGLSIEGVPLGRLNIMSLGMVRGEIVCRVPEEYDWTQFGASGAIITVNEVINKILAIPLPKKPRTTIVMGSIDGGSGFNTIARNASLKFEIRSESAEVVHEIEHRIKEIRMEVASGASADVDMNVVARREPGGLPFGHPLVRAARRIIEALDVPLRMGPSTSELAVFIERKIPAITIGMTMGEAMSETTESVFVDPIFTGLAQLIGILLAVDAGVCDED
jgi:acetylornithine deacetylase/succinyl-diaminopimelate desuccinylase-like protein